MSAPAPLYVAKHAKKTPVLQFKTIRKEAACPMLAPHKKESASNAYHLGTSERHFAIGAGIIFSLSALTTLILSAIYYGI